MSGADNQTIETARLTLRPPIASDFDAFAAMWGNPEVTLHIMPMPLDRENAWRMFLRDNGHWKVNGYGFFTAIDRETNSYAGTIGLAQLERDVDPPIGSDPEAGWAFAPEFHGQGYATEALHAVLQWGEALLLPKRFVAMIGETNQASARVAQKCGFRKYAATTYHGNPVILHERRS